jgi:hypothetical protein
MKKNILMLCLGAIAMSLMAFSYMSWNQAAPTSPTNPMNDISLITNPPSYVSLVYNIDSRFLANVTKEDLHNATSVLDIIPKSATDWWDIDFATVTVSVLNDLGEISEIGYEKELNAAQIKLLQSINYSNNFYIRALSKTTHPDSKILDNHVYYFTVIPEKEAEYPSGHDAIISYVQEHIQEYTYFIKDEKLKAGRVSFIVTKEGEIANVRLDSTCGYPQIDNHLMKLIQDIPEKWNPATNSKGEKIAQELIFFFGKQGC